MKLDKKQSGVVKYMLLGFIISLLVITLGILLEPPDSGGLDLRSAVFGGSVLLPALTLMFSIGRLARHRFLTPQDIDGSALAEDTEHAKLLQSLIQNTLEQFAILLGGYCSWCYIMPKETLMVPLLCSVLFFIGRIMFYTSYKGGATQRALGFTLAFYPTVLMVLIELLYSFWRIVS